MTRYCRITIAFLLFCLQSSWGVGAEAVPGSHSVRPRRRGEAESLQYRQLKDSTKKGSTKKGSKKDASTKKGSKKDASSKKGSTKKDSSKGSKGPGDKNAGSEEHRPRTPPSNPVPLPSSGAESKAAPEPVPSPPTESGPKATPTPVSTPVPESAPSPYEGVASKGTDEPLGASTKGPTDTPTQFSDEESDETPPPSAASLGGVDVMTVARALFPFSLRTSGTQPPIEEINFATEGYLYQRLRASFSNLDLISLTAISRNRRLEGRQLQAQTFTFVGEAVFVEESNQPLPTERRVFEEQMMALQDFQGLSEVVRDDTLGWEVDAIFFDGMTIDGGDGASEIGNDVNALSRGPVESHSASANNSNGLAISLFVVAGMLLTVAALVVRRRRRGNEQGGKTMKDLPANVGETFEVSDSECSDEDVQPAKNRSFGAVPIDSSSSQVNSRIATDVEWNSVFALSKTPVEQTSMDEVFNAKQLPPHTNSKTYEVVTLAPVSAIQYYDELPYGEEDSYGFGTLPAGGMHDSLVVSSPLSPDYVERREYSGDDRDLTMDLSDFDPRPDFEDDYSM